MFEKIKKLIIVEEDTSKKIKKFAPLLLILSFIAYLLFGATSLWFFEKRESDISYRQFFLNLAVNRRQFARDITQKIFNDTKNLFVIMDHEQTNRVQSHLIHSLRDYERQLNLKKPLKDEWNFENSLGYSWGLITTLGHSTKSPRTVAGQLFSLLYSIIGVPFFVITILFNSYRIFQLIKKRTTLYKHHLYYLSAIIFVFIIFVIGFSYFIYCTEIQKSYWKSLYLTILSSFSIHTNEYSNISEADKLTTLFAVTISLIFGFTILLYSFFVYDARESAKVATTEPSTGEIPRYQVIVSSEGETKIQPVQ